MNLIHGDCLKKMEDLSSNSIDIVVTDLPYGCFKSRLAWDKPIDLELMWEQLWRICKETTPIFLFGDMKFGANLINSCPKYFKYEICWNKGRTTTPLLSRKRFGKVTEYIFIFYKKQPVYNYAKYHKIVSSTQDNHKVQNNAIKFHYSNPIKRVYEPRLPVNIIEAPSVRLKKLIPNITEKPQFILEYILKYFSNEGDTCLDICMGSGSMGVACKTLNRKFIGIEMNKSHFDIAAKRLNGYII